MRNFLLILFLLSGFSIFAENNELRKNKIANDGDGWFDGIDTLDNNPHRLPSEYWPDADKIKDRNGRKQQFKDYINGNSLFAPRTRHMPAIGLSGGYSYTSGDVKARPGWGVGLFFRHNIGYLLSLRYDVAFHRTYGLNYEPVSLTGDLQNSRPNIRDDAYNGTNNGVNYATYKPDTIRTGITTAYSNYKNNIIDADVNLILNLGNILIHKPDNRWNVYGLVGFGGMLYKTWVDALDENGNPHDFNLATSLMDATKKTSTRGSNIAPSERRDVWQYLYNNVFEGRPRKMTFETASEGHKNEESLGSYVFNPIAHIGIGIEYLVGKKKRVSIGLEEKATFTNDDLVDSRRWTEQGDLTRDFDTYHYISGKLAVNLGSKKKRDLPMWWQNPTSQYLRKYEKPSPDCSGDADNDGVSDCFDQEADSKEGCPVDAKGVVRDSDGDGCPDCDDPEPFSSPQLPIKDCKNVFDFASKACCDQIKTILENPNFNKTSNNAPCLNATLPSVSYNADRFGVPTDAQSQLAEVARKMQDCPDLKLNVSGVTNSTKNIKYNEQLSYNRASDAIEFLVEKYGISRDRFILNYQGATINNAADAVNTVQFKFANEGEEGLSNPPAPHPGLKAGKK